jgi:epoxyqueuosine reductase
VTSPSGSAGPGRLREVASQLKGRGLESGLSLVGITSPEASAHGEFLRAWIDAGYHGEMAYLAREDALARRVDLRLTLESVRSVVVVAHRYDQPEPAPTVPSPDTPGRAGTQGTPEDPSVGIIARYARGRDYHTVLKKKLTELARWLDAEVSSNGPTRVYVDTGPILERDLARRAGLGWIGKNTMLINPGHGSYFFLGVLLTPVPLPPDDPFQADHCGSCTRCIDACPTNALLGRDESGAPVLDARRCISYLTIEQRGPIPEEFQGPMGNRIFGCDICQEVCPWNGLKFARPTSEADYLPSWREAAGRPKAFPGLPGTESPSLHALAGMTEEEWDSWTRGTAMRRPGHVGFQRNVTVALENWREPGSTVPGSTGREGPASSRG